MRRQFAASALVLIVGLSLSAVQGVFAAPGVANQSASTGQDLIGELRNAATLKNAGHFEQAEKILDQVLAKTASDPKNSEIDIAAKNLLAGVYLHTDRYEESLKTYKSCLPLVARSQGESSAAYATVLDNMAQAYLGLNRLPEAQENQSRSIKIYEALEPKFTQDLGQAYSNIAITYQKQGNLPETLEYEKKAQTLYEKVLPANHPLIAINKDNIGNTLQATGNFPEAEKYHREALGVLEPALGVHPDVAIAMDNLADTLSRERKYDESLQYFDKEMKVWTSLYGPQSKKALECANRREKVVQAAKQK